MAGLDPAIHVLRRHRFSVGRVTAAWSAQLSGRAVNDPGALNLARFTRHEVKFRVGFHF